MKQTQPPAHPMTADPMTKHRPAMKVLPTASSSGLPVPNYLRAHYWWAYVHPKAVRFFERQWLVNLILWGNYNRLRDAALSAFGPVASGKTLQVACAYGDLTPTLVGRMAPESTLDVVDILPVQLGNLATKLRPSERIKLHCMDSMALTFADRSFDQVLLFFLLHEQPAEVRHQTVREAIRVLKPGGTLIVMDYSRPSRFNPFRFLWKPVLRVLEPFANDLFDKGIAHWIPVGADLSEASRQDFFGGVYQLLTFRRRV